MRTNASITAPPAPPTTPPGTHHPITMPPAPPTTPPGMHHPTAMPPSKPSSEPQSPQIPLAANKKAPPSVASIPADIIKQYDTKNILITGLTYLFNQIKCGNSSYLTALFSNTGMPADKSLLPSWIIKLILPNRPDDQNISDYASMLMLPKDTPNKKRSLSVSLTIEKLSLLMTAYEQYHHVSDVKRSPTHQASTEHNKSSPPSPLLAYKKSPAKARPTRYDGVNASTMGVFANQRTINLLDKASQSTPPSHPKHNESNAVSEDEWNDEAPGNQSPRP